MVYDCVCNITVAGQVVFVVTIRYKKKLLSSNWLR